MKFENSIPLNEQTILEYWKTHDVFQKQDEKNKNNPEKIFFDGPPFATGLPHYGHILAGTLKDTFPRYWSMNGFKVDRKFGWDCHGLPIENEVQKRLNLNGTKDILDYGVYNFNEQCRSVVDMYVDEWEKTVNRMGRWVHFNGYKTMDTNFMESVWAVFKKCFDLGLIYEGYRIQPYSPKLETTLSNFEVNQGYKDVVDTSVVVKYRISENEYVLIWTTTPWSLLANQAVAVNKSIEYVKVKTNDEYFWICKDLVSFCFDTAEIVETCLGENLVGFEYEPIFNLNKKETFQIVSSDHVKNTSGTGFVHIAPAFGEDDFNVGKKYNLDVFDPFDAQCNVSVGEYSGIYFKDVEKNVVEYLTTYNWLFKKSQIKHSYPHCYRTNEPIMYRAMKTWFLSIDGEIENSGVKKSLKQWMIESNEQINWTPNHIKDGRFGNWLRTAHDWNISRNRFWGTPIPIYKNGTDVICVGSISELELLSGKTISDIHPHMISDISFTKDGKEYTRVDGIFDCWFESGSMPYAQKHWPFENLDSEFQADFIAEGLDQTRGWFYTLTVLSSVLFQKPAFKNVIVNGIILAADGQKMSKSLKNYPDPNILIDTYGADAIRLYMINSGVVNAEELKFEEFGVKDIVKNLFVPLMNSLNFYNNYYESDFQKGQLSWVPGEIRNVANDTDVWILSELQNLVNEITDSMETFSLSDVVPKLHKFIDNITNWYIRLNRERFWSAENSEDKNDAYFVLHTVLETLSKVMAPFCPFISDVVFLTINKSGSVHLEDFPKKKIVETFLFENFRNVQEIISCGRTIRSKNVIPTRQVLSSVIISGAGDIEHLHNYIQSELNVKQVIVSDSLIDKFDIIIKPNFKTLPVKCKNKMKDVTSYIKNVTFGDIFPNGIFKPISIDGVELSEDDVIVEKKPRPNFPIEGNNILVCLDVNITPELKEEYYLRQAKSMIQKFRKDNSCHFGTMVNIKVFSPNAEVLVKSIEQLQSETMTKISFVLGDCDNVTFL